MTLIPGGGGVNKKSRVSCLVWTTRVHHPAAFGPTTPTSSHMAQLATCPLRSTALFYGDVSRLHPKCAMVHSLTSGRGMDAMTGTYTSHDSNVLFV